MNEKYDQDTESNAEKQILSRREMLKAAAPALIAPVVLAAAASNAIAQTPQSNGRVALVTSSSRNIGSDQRRNRLNRSLGF